MERRCGGLGLAVTFVTAFVAPRWIASGILATPGGPEATPFRSAQAATRPSSSFHTTSADAILAHNAFDSTSVAVPAVPPVSSDLAGAPTCESVRVRAIAFSGDADWSVAALVVEGGSGSASLLRRRGGLVGHEVVDYVGVDRVWLLGERGVCQAGLFDRSPPRPPRPPPGPRAVATPGIVRSGASEFEVDRSVIDRIRQDPSQLMAFGQLVPERDASGTTLGVRLGTLKPGSLPTLLGLESGDRLDTINGFALANPEQLVMAYTRLVNASIVSLAIVRQGHPQAIDYVIK
jgi:general secretion pathway protein C